MRSHLSFTAFMILTLIFKSLIKMILGVTPFEFILLPVHLSFINVCIHVFYQICTPPSHFSSGREFNNTYTVLLDGVPQFYYGLFTFLQSFFYLFFRLDNFLCSVVKFADFFVLPFLPLTPSSEFFFQVFSFSAPEFLVSF